MTDVIQQLLELSDPGPVESSQATQPGQQLSITVGISQDILQVRRVPALVSVCHSLAPCLTDEYVPIEKLW